MMRIEAIVREAKVTDVQKALAALDKRGMTTWPARGSGRQKGHTTIYRGGEYDQSFVPKAVVVIFCEDAEVEEYICTIMNTAATGEIGDGIIAVSPVGTWIRIRTREKV